MAEADRHALLLQRAAGRVNEVLMREFGDLSPAEHAFVCDHVSALVHQSFHQHVVALSMQKVKKPTIITAPGPLR